MVEDIKFPQWEGYKDLEKMKQFISCGCLNDPNLILEYAAKTTLERTYFRDLLQFLQDRIQKYFEKGEGLGLGIDSSREIFEGLFIIPAEDVSFPEEENDKEDDKDKYEQFVRDMEIVGIEYEEYKGRFFYHGPAVRTNENGFPTLQDVVRATKVKLQWDNLGKSDLIVYPV